MQELNPPLTEHQLRYVRGKCDPPPTFTVPIDDKITELSLRGLSPAAIAEAIDQPGFSPNRVSKRWHNHLKWESTKSKSRPSERHLSLASYSTMWRLDEHEALAEATAVVGARSLHDEQCVAADAPRSARKAART